MEKKKKKHEKQRGKKRPLYVELLHTNTSSSKKSTKKSKRHCENQKHAHTKRKTRQTLWKRFSTPKRNPKAPKYHGITSSRIDEGYQILQYKLKAQLLGTNDASIADSANILKLLETHTATIQKKQSLGLWKESEKSARRLIHWEHPK